VLEFEFERLITPTTQHIRAISQHTRFGVLHATGGCTTSGPHLRLQWTPFLPSPAKNHPKERLYTKKSHDIALAWPCLFLNCMHIDDTCKGAHL
jgi:hypothetical protein